MAEKSTLARPYAEAVFALAKEQDALDKWLEVLELFAVVAVDEVMHNMLDNPKVTLVQKISVFNEVCADYTEAQAKNLVTLLIENNRMVVMPEILSLFSQLKLAHEDVMQINVTSAYSLDDKQQETLAGQLNQSFGKSVNLAVEVDEKIIGGVIIKAGDRVIDVSVRGQLEKMAAAMA